MAAARGGDQPIELLQLLRGQDSQGFTLGIELRNGH